MGTRARVLAVGPRFLGAMARHRIAQLEDRWTRFRPSELTRLNERNGDWVPVSADTLELVRRMCEGWRLTEGRFDPTVHDAMLANGYHRDLATIGAAGRPVDSAEPVAAPGCEGIAIDPIGGAVRLPPGVHLDAGGLGKGLAADLVTAELVEAGASGALVSLGGDVRVRGELGPDRPWRIAVKDPATGRVVSRLRLRDGGIATSSVARRRWRLSNGRRAHHLVDPRTGSPTDETVRSASVVASDCWRAEVLATATVVAGRRRTDVLGHRHSALVTLASGLREGSGAFAAAA